MKFLALATTALLSTSVAARSAIFGASVGGDITLKDTSFAVPGDNPLHHCEDPKDDILTLESVDLSPNPPKATYRSGQTLSVSAKGILTSDIEDGAKIHLSVKYGLITIIRQTSDLCELVSKVDLECPLHKGKETNLNKDVELPKEIPPGKYTVEANVVDKDEKKITCLKATVEFKIGGKIVWHLE
ncbi:Phosphatidylglycerol/phosphatidylinositol transfer protein [Elasticomyces elasticus]|nr:Phosphatidylglycerol/phosphatidylinositol transfer protein [Elasticomyces elasticus]KAK3657234.1 Phosphatidylglycerol/phosphatidylinositol transfer protein [Elasticomyces elasticus]KAK5760842.1 Phosphatidylglycerol/phosphatidylinositol transfer protein [Elasticomyces elasticus]